MNRGAAITAFLLGALSLGVFAWKTLALDMPVVPAGLQNLWTVELEIDVRGAGQRGSVRVALPSTRPGVQQVFDERFASDRLQFTIREEGSQRLGVWAGRISRVRRLSHQFRVQLATEGPVAPEGFAPPPSDEVLAALTRATARYPAAAPEVAERLEIFSPSVTRDPLGTVRTLFAFATDEIATVDIGSDDAVLTLTAREGSPLGKTRLLVTLLRGAGVPARRVSGLALELDHEPRAVEWAEAWVGGRWMPMSPAEPFFGRRPSTLLRLSTGERPLVEGTGVVAVGYRYRVLREQLRSEEITALMVPPSELFAALSLYRLPVATQSALRLLLLLPVGALIVALLRNLVGVRTFGTFMPLLIALVIREMSIAAGLAMVGVVMALGILGRLLLERLRLLLVPRLCILLCFVILAIVGLALAGRGLETRELFAGVLFPVVILAMLIERFSITATEEGLREASVRLGASAAVAAATFPVFQVPWIEHLMFGFPELVVTVIALLVALGGYTGYRIAELYRFRSLAVRPPREEAA